MLIVVPSELVHNLLESVPLYQFSSGPLLLDPPCNWTQLPLKVLGSLIINLLLVVLYIVLPLNLISPVSITPPVTCEPITCDPLTNSVPVLSIVNVDPLMVNVLPSIVISPKYVLGAGITGGLASTHCPPYCT